MGIRQELRWLAEEEADREISFLFEDDKDMQAILVDPENLKKILGGAIPEPEEDEEEEAGNQPPASKDKYITVNPKDCKKNGSRTQCVAPVPT